jgi:serine phosphatase RsbU (regulator of sigma subunit)
MSANVPPATSTSAPPEKMRCLEVWGGNQATDRQFEMPGLRVWIHSRPQGSALGGGDVYYVSSCASGRISRVLLADVSGHGEQVAGLGVGLRDLMRQNVNWVKQTRLVRAMNREFSRLAEQGGFATAVATTFYSPTRSLSICNAGHPSPLLFRQANRTWVEVVQQSSRPGKFTNTPLGIIDQAEYVQVETTLDPGDLGLLVSDALTDARNTDGQALRTQGLLQILHELDPGEPETLIQRLRQAVRSRYEGNLSEDDATILLLQATGSNIRFVDNLLAPLRLLRGIFDATSISR